MDVLIIDKTDQIASNLVVVRADVQTFSDEIKALNALENTPEAVVLLHHDFLQQQTVEYIKLLVAASSNSKIAVIANELNEEGILNCLLAGAKVYQHVDQFKHYANKLITVMDDVE